MNEPNNWETIITKQIQESVCDAVKARLAQGYHDSPLNKLIDSIIKQKAARLEDLLAGAMDAAIDSQTFKEQINEAFNHKLARVLVSKFEGEVEKRASELRSDPAFRAKVTLAIEKVVLDSAKHR